MMGWRNMALLGALLTGCNGGEGKVLDGTPPAGTGDTGTAADTDADADADADSGPGASSGASPE